jgi:hypothetical protein
LRLFRFDAHTDPQLLVSFFFYALEMESRYPPIPGTPNMLNNSHGSTRVHEHEHVASLRDTLQRSSTAITLSDKNKQTIESLFRDPALIVDDEDVKNVKILVLDIHKRCIEKESTNVENERVTCWHKHANLFTWLIEAAFIWAEFIDILGSVIVIALNLASMDTTGKALLITYLCMFGVFTAAEILMMLFMCYRNVDKGLWLKLLVGIPFIGAPMSLFAWVNFTKIHIRDYPREGINDEGYNKGDELIITRNFFQALFLSTLSLAMTNYSAIYDQNSSTSAYSASDAFSTSASCLSIFISIWRYASLKIKQLQRINNQGGGCGDFFLQCCNRGAQNVNGSAITSNLATNSGMQPTGSATSGSN